MNLSRELAACSKYRWDKGLWLRAPVVGPISAFIQKTSVYAEGEFHTRHAVEIDIEHPCTIGVHMAQLREALGDPYAYAAVTGEAIGDIFWAIWSTQPAPATERTEGAAVAVRLLQAYGARPTPGLRPW